MGCGVVKMEKFDIMVVTAFPFRQRTGEAFLWKDK